MALRKVKATIRPATKEDIKQYLDEEQALKKFKHNNLLNKQLIEKVK
ncbi:MAG: hypothetical protein J6D47_13195 [Peptostreptococcaceae bacterium]|nr:hypothetical protein [Peptostreptococcaceae bacterium]